MEIIRCKNGHSYDPSITPECPECARLKATEGTIPLSSMPGASWGSESFQKSDDIGKTEPLHEGFGKSRRRAEPAATEPVDNGDWRHWSNHNLFSDIADRDDDFATRPMEEIANAEENLSPVVGWLVCIQGPSKGKDYKIHAENNYIGRSQSMDICITGDTTISRENHAILAYDTREKLFYFAPGSGRGIVRLNGRAVLMMTELHAYDKIEIGKSILLFVPLCGESFSWEELND